MNNKQQINVWIKLIIGYSLFLGIIGIILLVGMALSKNNQKPRPEADQPLAETPTPTKGKFCGGIAGIKCPQGYTCKLAGKYPDAGGTCIQN